jgi:rod shape-determining protein MreD
MSRSGGRMLLSNQREMQVSHFRTWILVAVPLGAILCQVYLPLFFQFLSYLELPLLVVAYFGLMKRDPIRGLLLGAAVGLVQDSLSKNPLGMFGIVKTLVGYFAASIGIRLDVDHPAIRLVMAYFFFVFHQFFYWMLARALLRQSLPFDLWRTLFFGLFNAAVASVLYHFLDRLREKA